MSCFTVQLKPFDPIDRTNPQIIIRFQEECIKKNIFGMGFHIPEIFANQKEKLIISEFGLQYAYDYHQNPSVISHSDWLKGFDRTMNIYQRIRPGDYVLTRLFRSGDCYLGKTTSEAFYDNAFRKNNNFDYINNFSWIVPVKHWKLIGNIRHDTIDESYRGFLSFPYIVPTIVQLPITAQDDIRNAYSRISM